MGFKQNITFNLRKYNKGEIYSGLACQSCIKDFYFLEPVPKDTELTQFNPFSDDAYCLGRTLSYRNTGLGEKMRAQ